MSEYRDPRIDPREDDVLLVDGIATQVLYVSDEEIGEEERMTVWVEAHDITGAERAMSLSEWRTLAQHAVVLWQDDAPPAADVALLAAANRALAEQMATLTAERDEARRILLAIADDVYAHPYRYTVGMLRRVLGIPFSGVEVAAPDIRTAIRRLCGVSDG